GRAAHERVLSRLGVVGPAAAPPELVVRCWISLAEATALIWPAGRTIHGAGLETQLVHDFAALAAVAAAADEELATLLRGLLKNEPGDGPFTDLATRLIHLASG